MNDYPLPSISVIMPSFNSERFIRKAIDSVLNQNYPDLELIVMDGASRDRTVDILKSYGERITWFSEKDSGQSDAINRGLKIARGEILSWLNSDDIYAPNALREVGNYFTTNPVTQWVFGYCSIIDEKEKEIRWLVSAYKNFRMQRYSYRAHLTENFIPQMGVFFKRQAISIAGALDVSLNWAMDYDLWLRFGLRFQPGLIKRPLGSFRMYSTTKTVTGFRDGFKEDFSVAKRYAQGHQLALILHRFHNFKIVLIYSLISATDQLCLKIKKFFRTG